MKSYSFEKLECWQHARLLTIWTYNNTRMFPQDEKFGLVSQIRRSALSIASNISEGVSRKSSKDQCHFSTMAYSSSIELLNHLIISHDLKFINEDVYAEGREMIETVTKLVAGLRNAQMKQNTFNPKP